MTIEVTNTTITDTIRRTEQFVKAKLEGENSGHDWGHIDRVRRLAMKIAKEEKSANTTIIELAALLHDIADWKFHGDGAGQREARKWLESIFIDETTIASVCDIVQNISFKKNAPQVPLSIEGKIVQDADRLDAMGAIGVARAFAYGGNRGRDMKESVQHFYEKLLLLKDRMNTNTAKKLAAKRHQFMLDYLKQFYGETKEED